MLQLQTEQKISYTAEEMLSFLLAGGKLNIDDVAEEMKNAERQKILVKHPYAITQGKDGRWRSYLPIADGKRKQIAKSSREKLEDAIVEFYTNPNGSKKEEKAKEPTLESMFGEWCEYKKLHGASSTYMLRIESDWRNHYASDEIVSRPIRSLTKLDMDMWAHILIKKLNGSKKNYHNISMIMRQMLDLAVDMQIIAENPLSKGKIDSRMVFTPQKKKASETQVFSKSEVTALFEAATADFKNGYNHKHKLAPLAVKFQFLTGVRLGELCALRYEDVTDEEIYVNRMYRYETKELVEYTKAKRDGRYVPLTAEAKAIISTAKQFQQEHDLPSDGFIFSVDDEPLSYYAVRKLYKRYCDMIGTINKSSHKSRKTYISALIEGGVSIDSIREIAGHADERTTYKSYVFDRKTKKERVELIEKALSE